MRSLIEFAVRFGKDHSPRGFIRSKRRIAWRLARFGKGQDYFHLLDCLESEIADLIDICDEIRNEEKDSVNLDDMDD